jgi:hypothetical protein
MFGSSNGQLSVGTMNAIAMTHPMHWEGVIIGRQSEALEQGGGCEYIITHGSLEQKELLHASHNCLTKPKLRREMVMPCPATSSRLILQVCLRLAVTILNVPRIPSNLLWTQTRLLHIVGSLAQVDQEMDSKIMFRKRGSLFCYILSNQTYAYFSNSPDIINSAMHIHDVVEEI